MLTWFWIEIAVEGLWSNWDSWGSCSGTCDSDAKRNRTRNFTGGNTPCSGNATEEGTCSGGIVLLYQISIIIIYTLISVEGSWSTWNPWGTCLGTCDSDAKWNRTRNFTGGNMPCSDNATEEGNCTGAKIKFLICFSYLSMHHNISVEGLWTTWDPWGTCLGTCDSDAKKNRTRSFTGGNMPCSGDATHEGSCTGVSLITKNPKTYWHNLIYHCSRRFLG